MVKIIADSSTMFSQKEGTERNIDILPLMVMIDNKSYMDNEEIHTEKLIELINEGHIPSTSQPSIGQVVEVYEKYAGEEIINITMADGLSGTYNSACSAKNVIENSENIHVINSKTLCGPHRYIVEVANKLAEENKSANEIIEVVEKISETTVSYLIPNDFEFLVRGGRISALAGRIGGAIKLVPVMKHTPNDSSLVKFTTKRTFNKAIQKICDDLLSFGVDSNYKMYICHSCREDLADISKSVIMENISDLDIEIHKLSPAFTVQGGPGCISIQVVKKYEF